MAQDQDVFQQRVSMARPVCQAGEDQEHRFGERAGVGPVASRHDMSHNDMLSYDRSPVKSPASSPSSPAPGQLRPAGGTLKSKLAGFSRNRGDSYPGG